MFVCLCKRYIIINTSYILLYILNVKFTTYKTDLPSSLFREIETSLIKRMTIISLFSAGKF